MRRNFAWAVAGLLVLSACGSGDRSSGATAPAGDATAEPGASPLPQIEVDDVTNDRRVALEAFVPSDRPTLIWFWAPH